MTGPHILLSGDTLALGLPHADMLPEYHRWENDPGVILGYGTQLPQSWETRAAGYEGQARGSDRYAQFEVIRIKDEHPIGMTILQVDHQVRTAEYIILLAPEAHGHATEATRLTLDWAFHLAALRMVWLKVLAPNTAGRRAYQNAGFRHAGQLRQSGYWLGQPCDEILMDATPTDFTGPSAVLALTTRPPAHTPDPDAGQRQK
ncbi:MAG: GNAT family N-acetyltransferase [Pseudonocardiaceae bacterium]